MIRKIHSLLFFLLPFVFFLQTRVPLFNQFQAIDYLIGFVYLRDVVVLLFSIATTIRYKKAIIEWVRTKQYFMLIVGLLCLSSVLSISHAIMASVAVLKTVQLINYVIFSITFGYTIQFDFNKWEDWLIWWLLPFIPIALMAVWEFTEGYSLGIWILGNWEFSSLSLAVAKVNLFGVEFLRPYATFAHPNVLGGVSAIFFVLGIYVFKNSQKHTVLTLCAITALWVLILLSFSRSAWIGLIVGGAYVLFSYNRNKPNKLSKRVIILAVCSVLFILPYTLKLFSINEQSITDRIYLYEKSVEIFKTHWLFGVGQGNFLPALLNIVKSGNPRVVQPVHNVPVLSFVEIGFVGAFSYIMVWVLFLSNSLKKSFCNSGMVVRVVLLIMFSLWMFDHYVWSISMGQALYWFIIGLGLSVLQSGEQQLWEYYARTK